METLNSYITERIRIDNIKSIDFTKPFKVDEIMEFKTWDNVWGDIKESGKPWYVFTAESKYSYLENKKILAFISPESKWIFYLYGRHRDWWGLVGKDDSFRIVKDYEKLCETISKNFDGYRYEHAEISEVKKMITTDNVSEIAKKFIEYCGDDPDSY